MSDENKVTVSYDYLKTIEKKVEDLKMLTEISTIISSTLDFNDLLTLVMEKAKSIMEAEACSILLLNREINKLEFQVAICKDGTSSEVLKKKVYLEIGQGIAGWVAANLKPLVVDDVKTDRRFFAEADKQTGFTTRNLIAVPLVGRSGLIGVAELLNFNKKDYDLEILLILNRHFATAIENAIFYRESLERERLKQELEIASSIQRSFLPEPPFFQKDNITISALNFPAKHVGGDIYDFVEPCEGKVGVFIGDVSGKGVSAALYMAKIISDFGYISHRVDSPGVALNSLNSLLSSAPRGMFLTAIYMIVDTAKGKINVSVAGHPPFLWVTKGDVRVMDIASGPPLGITSMEYPSTTLELGKGDRLLLLTDGVFDAKNRSGERIGFENLVKFIRENLSKDNIIQIVVDYVNDYSKGMERADDLTMVEIRHNGLV